MAEFETVWRHTAGDEESEGLTACPMAGGQSSNRSVGPSEKGDLNYSIWPFMDYGNIDWNYRTYSATLEKIVNHAVYFISSGNGSS